MHTHSTLVMFGPNLEEKYCDIDSFTFSVGLQSVISGLRIKYKMFNNMTESSKICLFYALERALFIVERKSSRFLYYFVNLNVNMFKSLANMQIVSLSFFSRENSRKYPDTQLFCNSFG